MSTSSFSAQRLTYGSQSDDQRQEQSPYLWIDAFNGGYRRFFFEFAYSYIRMATDVPTQMSLTANATASKREIYWRLRSLPE